MGSNPHFGAILRFFGIRKRRMFPRTPLKPRKMSAAWAETGVLCTPPAALRRTLTITITPVTFASGAAAPGSGLYTLALATHNRTSTSAGTAPRPR
jgi:hypothetical protein